MASESLRRDVAIKMTAHLIEVFAPLLRGEEINDAYIEVMAIVLGGMETFEILESRASRNRVELPSLN
jgi:hypothetical protein